MNRSSPRMVWGLISALLWSVPPGAFGQTEGGAYCMGYQGSLIHQRAPFTGFVNIGWSMYDDPLGGNRVGSGAPAPVDVRNGLFFTNMEFGPEILGFLEEGNLWLQIEVNGTTLQPRQQITAAPRALHALRAISAREAANRFCITGNAGELKFDTGTIAIDPARAGLRIDFNEVFFGDVNDRTAVHFGNDIGDPEIGTERGLAGLKIGPGDTYLFSDANERIALHLGTGAGNPEIALDVRVGPGLLLGGSEVYLGGPDTVTPKLHLGGVSDPEIRLDRAAGSVVIDSARVTVGNPEIAEALVFAGGPALLSSLTERGVIAIISPSPQVAEGLRFGATGPGLRHDPGTAGIIIIGGRELTIGDANDGGPKALRFGSDPRNPLPFISTSALNAQVLSINAPHSLRLEGGFVGVGLASTQAPAFRLDLPNTAGPAGQGRANAWTTYSSRRWKENIRPITAALDKISRLEGVTFDWKPDHGGAPDIGFVAEDVAAVLPELVEWEDDGGAALSLKYDRMSALAIQGIKEQQELIKELRAENDDLRARLERLEAALAAHAR